MFSITINEYFVKFFVKWAPKELFSKSSLGILKNFKAEVCTDIEV